MPKMPPGEKSICYRDFGDGVRSGEGLGTLRRLIKPPFFQSGTLTVSGQNDYGGIGNDVTFPFCKRLPILSRYFYWLENLS